MKNIKAGEADTLMSETSSTPDANRGGQPTLINKSIRKRAFHRALKRKEFWAIAELAEKMFAEALCNSLYSIPKEEFTAQWTGVRDLL